MSKDFIDFDDSDDEDMVVIGGIETRKKRPSNKKQIVLYNADDILISCKDATENSRYVLDVGDNADPNTITNNAKGEIENYPADKNDISKDFDLQSNVAPNIIPHDSPILHISTTDKVLNAYPHPATNQISFDDEDRVLTTKEIILFEQHRQVKKGFPKPQTIGTVFPGRKPIPPITAVMPSIKEMTKEEASDPVTARTHNNLNLSKREEIIIVDASSVVDTLENKIDILGANLLPLLQSNENDGDKDMDVSESIGENDQLSMETFPMEENTVDIVPAPSMIDDAPIISDQSTLSAPLQLQKPKVRDCAINTDLHLGLLSPVLDSSPIRTSKSDNHSDNTKESNINNSLKRLDSKAIESFFDPILNNIRLQQKSSSTVDYLASFEPHVVRALDGYNSLRRWRIRPMTETRKVLLDIVTRQTQLMREHYAELSRVVEEFKLSWDIQDSDFSSSRWKGNDSQTSTANDDDLCKQLTGEFIDPLFRKLEIHDSLASMQDLIWTGHEIVSLVIRECCLNSVYHHTHDHDDKHPLIFLANAMWQKYQNEEIHCLFDFKRELLAEAKRIIEALRYVNAFAYFSFDDLPHRPEVETNPVMPQEDLKVSIAAATARANAVAISIAHETSALSSVSENAHDFESSWLPALPTTTTKHQEAIAHEVDTLVQAQAQVLQGNFSPLEEGEIADSPVNIAGDHPSGVGAPYNLVSVNPLLAWEAYLQPKNSHEKTTSNGNDHPPRKWTKKEKLELKQLNAKIARKEKLSTEEKKRFWELLPPADREEKRNKHRREKDPTNYGLASHTPTVTESTLSPVLLVSSPLVYTNEDEGNNSMSLTMDATEDPIVVLTASDNEDVKREDDNNVLTAIVDEFSADASSTREDLRDTPAVDIHVHAVNTKQLDNLIKTSNKKSTISSNMEDNSVPIASSTTDISSKQKQTRDVRTSQSSLNSSSSSRSNASLPPEEPKVAYSSYEEWKNRKKTALGGNNNRSDPLTNSRDGTSSSGTSVFHSPQTSSASYNSNNDGILSAIVDNFSADYPTVPPPRSTSKRSRDEYEEHHLNEPPRETLKKSKPSSSLGENSSHYGPSTSSGKKEEVHLESSSNGKLQNLSAQSKNGRSIVTEVNPPGENKVVYDSYEAWKNRKKASTSTSNGSSRETSQRSESTSSWNSCEPYSSTNNKTILSAIVDSFSGDYSTASKRDSQAVPKDSLKRSETNSSYAGPTTTRPISSNSLQSQSHGVEEPKGIYDSYQSWKTKHKTSSSSNSTTDSSDKREDNLSNTMSTTLTSSSNSSLHMMDANILSPNDDLLQSSRPRPPKRQPPMEEIPTLPILRLSDPLHTTEIRCFACNRKKHPCATCPYADHIDANKDPNVSWYQSKGYRRLRKYLESNPPEVEVLLNVLPLTIQSNGERYRITKKANGDPIP